MSDRKYSRDLNMIMNDPDPQKSYVVMGQKGKDPLKLYVGDQTPEGDVLEEIGERSATFLPPYQKDATTQAPAYTRSMGDNPWPAKTPPPQPGSSQKELADWSQQFLDDFAKIDPATLADLDDLDDEDISISAQPFGTHLSKLREEMWHQMEQDYDDGL